MNSSKVLLGVLLGVAAGAAMGILFAPEKGSTTRRDILDKGEGYLDDIKGTFNDMMETLAQKFDMAKNEAETIVENGKYKFNEAKRDGKAVVNA